MKKTACGLIAIFLLASMSLQAASSATGVRPIPIEVAAGHGPFAFSYADRVDFWYRVLHWFDKYLKGP